jgi:hypothetical protein
MSLVTILLRIPLLFFMYIRPNFSDYSSEPKNQESNIHRSYSTLTTLKIYIV